MANIDHSVLICDEIQHTDTFYDATSNLDDTTPDGAEIVDSAVFEIPVTPIGNLGTATLLEPLAGDQLLFDLVQDPFQYRSFDA